MSERENTRTNAPPTVLAVPDYREANPYQSRLAAALEGEGVRTRTVSGRGRIVPISRALLAAGRPPVLHVHFLAPFIAFEGRQIGPVDTGSLLSVLGALRLLVDLSLAALLTDRVVWTAHDLWDHERRVNRTELVVKHLFVRALCDAVILHCKCAEDLLVETFRLPETIRRRMYVIPHGHFLDDYPDGTTRATARAALDLPADATVVLFFGLIRRYKNVPALVDTFARINGEDLRLVVAGNPRTDALAAKVRNAAARDSRVRTALEFVPTDEVQTYFRAADAVVYPFRTEDQTLLTSGSVVLAMGFGRAVVAPRLGCVGAVLTAGPPTREATDAVVTSDSTATTDAPASVSVVAGGVVYESSSELEAALRTALNADLEGMGDRNQAQVESIGWDRIARLTATVYAGVDGTL